MTVVLTRVLALLLLLAQVWIGCARGTSICVSLGDGCGEAPSAPLTEESPCTQASRCCEGHGDPGQEGQPEREGGHKAAGHDHEHDAAITLVVDHDPCCCCVHLPGGVRDLTSTLVDRSDRTGDRLDSVPAPELPPDLFGTPLRVASLTTLVAPRHPPPHRAVFAESRAIRVTRLLV
jgi:hypothetical protein